MPYQIDNKIDGSEKGAQSIYRRYITITILVELGHGGIEGTVSQLQGCKNDEERHGGAVNGGNTHFICRHKSCEQRQGYDANGILQNVADGICR